jgi:hypothetical protein
MTSNDFAYWLQGYVEITNGQMPNETQWVIIKDHLKEVFVKNTPDHYLSDQTYFNGMYIPTGLNPTVPISC